MATYVWTPQKSYDQDPTNASDWTVNGAVAKTAPTSKDDVVIPKGVDATFGEYGSNYTLSYKSLTVENGASLTLPDGSTTTINAPLIINGSFETSAKTLTLNSPVTGSGSFTQDSNGTTNAKENINVGSFNNSSNGVVNADKNITAVDADVSGGKVNISGVLTVTDQLSQSGYSFVTVVKGVVLGSSHDKASTETALSLRGNPTLKSENGLSVNGVYVTQENVYVSNGVDAPNKMTVIITCFLAGSMLRTPTGDVAVEDIKVGDNIITFDVENNKEVSKPVAWVGKAHATIKPGLDDDQAGWPVRICQNAFAEGIPYKDMLITSEHCLYFDGKFVPVRMLVNGVSIFYDKTIHSYDYYHVETAEHSVVMADGMLTESYLDTGNRYSFNRGEKIVNITPSRKLTWDNAAAPLDITREFVEPIFKNAENRAKKLGYQIKSEPALLTDDAGLHLVTENGMIIRAARKDGNSVVFMLPPAVNNVRIVSRASRPVDVIGPFVDDRRYFGVAISKITLCDQNNQHSVTHHLTEKNLDGWNDLEDQTIRWTSGNAVLPIGPRTPNGLAVLTITVEASGPYLATTETRKKIMISA